MTEEKEETSQKNPLQRSSTQLGIRAKLSLLTTLMIVATLIITLFISSYREIEFKKDEASKLMINLGKQIALMKGLKEPIASSLMSEYLDKTVHTSIAKRGYSISIVYILTLTPEGQLEIPVFNWNMIQTQNQDAQLLGQKILEGKFPINKNIRNVKIEMGEKGGLYIGFSLKILKNEIIEAVFEHVAIGFGLILIGILISIWVSNKITEPLFDLIQGFKRVSKGDFNAQTAIKTHDELEDLSDSFNQMTLGLRERELIKDIFRRYATDQVVEKILEGKVRPTLSGELRDVTVLFSDIRMFTSMAAKLQPEKIVYVLNLYFTSMTEVAIRNEGLIDKFTGDEMMVVFGAPIQHPDDPMRALRTAQEMFHELKKVNEQLEKEGYQKIEIGIGINTGVAIAGNIGSEKRMAYTVIGQDVNLASRLVSLAGKGEIVSSLSTYEKSGKQIPAKSEIVQLKGLDTPIRIYRIDPLSVRI